MERLITKSFKRLLDKGIHRGFITHEELGKSLGKRHFSQQNVEAAFLHIFDNKICLVEKKSDYSINKKRELGTSDPQKNKETENHLQSLGAQNIKSYGNLKFAKTKKDTNQKLNSNFLDKIKNRKIWCAASTHPSEEIFWAQTHLELKKTYNDILTIIIPRHINRIDEINNQLSNLNLKVIKYTNFTHLKNDTDILLVDAYGETIKFYNISKCVFVGKSLPESLKDVSGQNPIEPSRLGCKIFHGPNVSNFRDVYEYLASLNVANKVENPKELSQMLVDELKTEKLNNYEIVKKIENYGTNTLNNVLREIKIYINN